jgi:hypothetical protein
MHYDPDFVGGETEAGCQLYWPSSSRPINLSPRSGGGGSDLRTHQPSTETLLGKERGSTIPSKGQSIQVGGWWLPVLGAGHRQWQQLDPRGLTRK